MWVADTGRTGMDEGTDISTRHKTCSGQVAWVYSLKVWVLFTYIPGIAYLYILVIFMSDLPNYVDEPFENRILKDRCITQRWKNWWVVILDLTRLAYKGYGVKARKRY